MIRKHKSHPRAVVSIPVGLYAGTVFLLATTLLGFLGAPQNSAWIVLLSAGGLTAILGMITIFSTKTIQVLDDHLLIKTPFGEKRHEIQDAKLSYMYTGTTNHPNYMLVLKRPHENPVRLVSLGMGMDMLRELRKAEWLSEILGFTLEVPHNVQQAAAIQGRATSFSLRYLPFFFFGLVVLGGGVAMIMTLIQGKPDRASIRFQCKGKTSFNVDGVQFDKEGAFSVGVKPGIRTVRWKSGTVTRLYKIPIKKGEHFVFRCDAPPTKYLTIDRSP